MSPPLSLLSIHTSPLLSIHRCVHVPLQADICPTNLSFQKRWSRPPLSGCRCSRRGLCGCCLVCPSPNPPVLHSCTCMWRSWVCAAQVFLQVKCVCILIAIAIQCQGSVHEASTPTSPRAAHHMDVITLPTYHSQGGPTHLSHKPVRFIHCDMGLASNTHHIIYILWLLLN